MAEDSKLQLAEVRARQLFDSALPNGGYAHSQGLEGLVQAGEIATEKDLLSFVREEFADSLISTEFPIFRAASTVAEAGRWEDLLSLDDLARATKPSAELRQAGAMMGRQTYLLYTRILPAGGIEEQRLSRAGEFLEHFQITVVMGSIGACLGIPLSIALPAYGSQLLANLVVPAVKLLQFGPSQVQRLLFELGAELPDWIEASAHVARADVGNTAPRWDIASANHASAESRLFIS